MALTIPQRDENYDSINENSSNDEKLDIVFRLLVEESIYNYIHYEKLFINYNQQPVFNARIEGTGFVDCQQPDGSQKMYRLKSEARILLDKYDNSFLKYLEETKEY